MSNEPTLTESPVPLALARLQGRGGGGRLRAHRPSLPLASLQEAADETPRRFSDELLPDAAPDTDDDEAFEDAASPASQRRASDAAFAERYRKLNDFDGPPPEVPRRASLAVPPAGDALRADKGRRRSWAAKLQLERKKRRTSGGDTDEEDPAPYARQKRPSWWNVFVPDNVLKSRYTASRVITAH